MGTISNYILDGETVATSTTVSNTNGTPAPTGWYKDSSGVRYATNGYFLSGPAVDCDCAETCSDPSGAPTTITRPTGTVSEDYYEFTTGQNTGVSLVRFTPNNVPVGIAVGNSSPGVVPNTWGNTLSPFEHTRIAAGPFFLGNSADDFGLVANSPWTNITDREYYNGTWSNTGNFSAYSVGPGSLSLDPYNPGTLVLPVSKSTTGSMSIYIYVTSLDTTCTYSLSVTCPQVIPEAYRYLRTSEGFNCNNSVIFPLPTYLLSPSGAIAPSQGDFLFSDNLGQNPVSDGQYVMHRTGVLPSVQKYVVNVTNGVITGTILCP